MYVVHPRPYRPLVGRHKPDELPHPQPVRNARDGREVLGVHVEIGVREKHFGIHGKMAK